MKQTTVLITGATGLIGKELTQFLEAHHYFVIQLERPFSKSKNSWDYLNKKINFVKNNTIDIIIHLAGKNIASARWSQKVKNAIIESRIQSTAFLGEYFTQQNNKPKLFICASAIGIYGDQADHILTEDSPVGTGFLANVCQQWEESSTIFKNAQVRTVNLRLGTVLHHNGGALKEMLPFFKAGIGGQLGNGKQYLSWITVEEVLNIIHFIIQNENIQGAVNSVSKKAITNYQFTKALGAILKKPTLLPIPKFAIQLLYGQMGKELLLQSLRVFPKKLVDAGFQFQEGDIKKHLSHILYQNPNKSK